VTRRVRTRPGLAGRRGFDSGAPRSAPRGPPAQPPSGRTGRHRRRLIRTGRSSGAANRPARGHASPAFAPSRSLDAATPPTGRESRRLSAQVTNRATLRRSFQRPRSGRRRRRSSASRTDATAAAGAAGGGPGSSLVAASHRSSTCAGRREGGSAPDWMRSPNAWRRARRFSAAAAAIVAVTVSRSASSSRRSRAPADASRRGESPAASPAALSGSVRTGVCERLFIRVSPLSGHRGRGQLRPGYGRSSVHGTASAALPSGKTPPETGPSR